MPAIGGTMPWAIRRHKLSSTTNWVVYTAPDRARRVVVKNLHASATLYVGNYDETGAAALADDNYTELAAGESLTLTLSSGRSPVSDADHLDIPLHSTTADHPVSFVVVEASE